MKNYILTSTTSKILGPQKGHCGFFFKNYILSKIRRTVVRSTLFWKIHMNIFLLQTLPYLKILTPAQLFLCNLWLWISQGPLITDGRNSNEMLTLTVGWPWHFKSNEDIITKFEWHWFQIIRINRKKFDGSGITSFYFPVLMKMVIFGPFSQYRAKA